MADSATPVWRLLDDGRCDASWNMAVDRAIQLEHASSESPPTIRLYGWTKPTVTLGRFQKLDGVELSECRASGADVVRRFTGGRGVLHDDELTYSFVVGERDGLPRGVAASYRMLCGALARAYIALGVRAELTARPRGASDSSACYLHATQADLSVGAAKLSGSAQVWHNGTCLQHGSFVRSRNIAREARIFMLGSDGARALAASTATLQDLLDPVPSLDDIRDAVIQSVARELDVVIVPGVLTDSERRLAQSLLADVQMDGAE